MFNCAFKVTVVESLAELPQEELPPEKVIVSQLLSIVNHLNLQFRSTKSVSVLQLINGFNKGPFKQMSSCKITQLSATTRLQGNARRFQWDT